MNKQQQQNAMLKLATVRLAINHVLRQRAMQKQAGGGLPRPIQTAPPDKSYYARQALNAITSGIASKPISFNNALLQTGAGIVGGANGVQRALSDINTYNPDSENYQGYWFGPSSGLLNTDTGTYERIPFGIGSRDIDDPMTNISAEGGQHLGYYGTRLLGLPLELKNRAKIKK